MKHPLLPYVRESFSGIKAPPLPTTKAERSEHQAIGQVVRRRKVWFSWFKRRIQLTISFSAEQRKHFSEYRCPQATLPKKVKMFVPIEKYDDYGSHTQIGILFGFANKYECRRTGENPLVALEGVKMGGSW